MNFKISSLVKALCKAYGRTGPEGMVEQLGEDFIARAESAAMVHAPDAPQHLDILEAVNDINAIVDGLNFPGDE
jgi:crotonobetainyl-CoA:carnitine CoA-transferase CaiB-like acyl-CoA transferase